MFVRFADSVDFEHRARAVLYLSISCFKSFSLNWRWILSRMHSSHLRFLCALLIFYFRWFVRSVWLCGFILLFISSVPSVCCDWWIKLLSFVDETSSHSAAYAWIVCHGFRSRYTFRDSFHRNIRTHRSAILAVCCTLTKNQKPINGYRRNPSEIKAVWQSFTTTTKHWQKRHQNTIKICTRKNPTQDTIQANENNVNKIEK